MQLSKTQKPFSQYFANFLNFALDFEYFEKKEDLHSLCISEVTDWKTSG